MALNNYGATSQQTNPNYNPATDVSPNGNLDPTSSDAAGFSPSTPETNGAVTGSPGVSSGNSAYADQVSNLSYALDTHAAQAGDPSIFTSAANVVTKAIPLTGLQIVNSFANTGIELGNWVTGNDVDKWSIDAEAPGVEAITGQTGLAQYYQDHKQGIDAASLLAGSLIPGLAGIKALKYGTSALEAYTGLAEGGEATGVLARATGLLPSLQMKGVMKVATDAVENPESIFNTLSRQKTAMIGLGALDQALQGLVYETATAATMKANPLMDDQTLDDVVENIGFGALAGGVIGGAFEGIGIASKFKKMANDMDTATKAQQIVDQTGIGNYSVGDRVNTMLNTITSRPAPQSVAGAKYASITADQTFMKIKEALLELPGGDNDVTNSLADVTWKAWKNGELSPQAMHERFNNIAAAQRITSDVVPNIDDGTFYVNKRAPNNRAPNDTNFDDLVTSNSQVAPGTDFNLRYRMSPDAINTSPQTASWKDTFIDVNGVPQQKYSNSSEAFKDGIDLFHNSAGEVIVNPNSVNIQQIAKLGESRALSQAEEFALNTKGQLPPVKPGQSAATPITSGNSSGRFAMGPNLPATVDTLPGATILNTQDGSITNSAIATVGDHGNISVAKDGVNYGVKGSEQFSPQSIGSEIGPDTKAVDASARYAWFAGRGGSINAGIKAGEDVSSTDIPALEALYRQLSNSTTGTTFADNAATATNKFKITLDGDELPSHAPDLLDMIKSAKDEQLTQDIPNMSSEEAALRANVSQDYIKNNFQGPQSDMMLPPSANNSIKHVQLWYDIGNLNMQDGNILKGMIDTGYRVQLVKASARDAAAAHFGPNAEQFNIEGNTANAGLGNAPGGKFLSFSSADYNTYPQQFERIGRALSGKNSSDIQAINDALTPSANALRNNPEAAANLNMFEAVRQRAAGNKFTFLSPELESKYIIKDGSQPTGNVAVLKDSLKPDADGNLDWNPQYIPQGFVDGSKIASGELPGTTAGIRNYYQLHPVVADFEKAAQSVNDATLVGRNNFNAANGLQRTYDTGNLYVPPVDTKKYPYFAYLKAKEGSGMADDSVHVVTAQSASELQGKIDAFAGNYSVFTKTGDTSTAMLHKLEGDYNYNRNFADNRVSADAANKGVLNNILPETNVENTIQRRYDFLVRNKVQLNRDFVELANGQTFAELKGMGDMINGVNNSKFGYVPPSQARQVVNPYQNFINTALNISPKEQYTTWQWANEKLESLFSTAFDAAKSGFDSASKGIIPFDKASDLAESYGLGKIYEQASKPIIAYYKLADNAESSKALSKFVGGANTVLSTGIIRLDAYQSLIHAITTPMLAAVESVSAKSQIIKGLVSSALPDVATGAPALAADGSQIQMPSTVKLLFNAVKNYWNRDTPEIAQYADMYNNVGADKTALGVHSQMMDQLALPQGSFTPTDLTDKLKSAVELGQKLSLSNWTNTFNHFISADVGRQIFEAAGFTGQSLEDQVMTFVNRVQGNYIAGQRPVAFQGPIGQAVGLFQTFGLNMLQNLTRYVANGEGKTLGLLGGLQTSLFGLQGMPGFNFLNQHLVGTAAGNPNNNDLYSGITSLLGGGKGTLGDYLLYGATSNILDANLYNRGDISPRNPTILPVNPLDFPVIKGGINIMGNLIDTAGKIANGGNLPASLLTGLEHNGLSRPLAGLAQLAQGFATDKDGNVIGTTQGVNGNSELFSMANFSRLMGARPLDEAVALGAQYRYNYYTTKSEAKINDLGMALKTQMYGDGSGSQIDPGEIENFAAKYAAVGGDIGKFNSFVTRTAQKANGASANKVFGTLAGSGRAQNMMLQMGGKQLPDYLNSGSTQQSQTADTVNTDDTQQQ
jgi:hypothetical protein